MDLKEFFQQNPRAALGFSGGVDSAFLLAMAVKYKAQVQPYFIKTAFQPEFELHDARELTRRLGVELTVIEHDILSSRQPVMAIPIPPPSLIPREVQEYMVPSTLLCFVR